MSRYYIHAMRPPLRALALLSVASLALGFLLANQLRTQLLVPSNRIARNEALVRSVQDLERANASHRREVSQLRGQVNDLESRAAQRTDSTRRLQDEVTSLRGHAGLTAMHGPGVTVDLANGKAGLDPTDSTGYLLRFQDIEDVVTLLFGSGAEGVAVSGRRITPISAFAGSGSTIVIDQGPPLTSPFHIVAVGNRGGMEQMLGDPGNLGDLKNRQRRFQLRFDWSGVPDLNLPTYDSSLEATYARPA